MAEGTVELHPLQVKDESKTGLKIRQYTHGATAMFVMVIAVNSVFAIRGISADLSELMSFHFFLRMIVNLVIIFIALVSSALYILSTVPISLTHLCDRARFGAISRIWEMLCVSTSVR